jgi:proteasome lid subunit RPN8/RPN11
MKLRVFHSYWRPFIDELRARKDVESAGIILADRLQSGTMLARELIVLPDAAYSIRQRDRIRIDPVALNRLIRPARDRGLSVFTIHTHPNSDLPWFSAADDAGDSVLMPSMFAQMDGPHGSLVIAGDTGVVCARAWMSPNEIVPMNVHEVGMALRVTSSDGQIGTEHWFDRQRLALSRYELRYPCIAP